MSTRSLLDGTRPDLGGGNWKWTHTGQTNVNRDRAQTLHLQFYSDRLRCRGYCWHVNVSTFLEHTEPTARFAARDYGDEPRPEEARFSGEDPRRLTNIEKIKKAML